MSPKVPLAAVFLALFSLSAMGAEEGDEPLRSKLIFEGTERIYYVRLPYDFDPEKIYWPLVTVHGGNGNGRNHSLGKGTRWAADEQGLDAIVISPNFSNDDFQASRFPALGEGPFLERVLEDIRLRYKLHPKILLTGYSRGGQFTHRFAFTYPEMVAAVAPLAAGTWTTPDGALLIEQYGRVAEPEAFLSDSENASLAPARLSNIFTPRVASAAGIPALPASKGVPFLVMCGTLDTRVDIARLFAASLKEKGYHVETAWPRTPHGGRNKEEFKAEFQKYPQGAVAFFKRIVAE
jgi:pimeloyl-ACP methyl ester carboxylesterase